ncbi:MAG: alpha/beta hydrolase [Bacteroidetes bacterium]|nr:MAG: alpha/beta hydrolase [Bacteroidota bacterium]
MLVVKKYLNLKVIIAVLILTVIIIIYAIPAKQKNFFELYGKKDKVSESLKKFQKKTVKFIEMNGVRWKYFSGGTGDKTILFLHGMGGAYDIWWQQVDFFEKKYRIITYTLPKEIDNLEDASNGILKILDNEKVGNFYLTGTSMGGYIAQYLLQKIPDRIDKIVLSNTFPPNHIMLEENKFKSKIVPLLPEILIAKLGEKQLKEKLIPAAENSKLLAAFLPSLPFSKKQFVNRYYVVIDYFKVIPDDPNIKRIPKLIIESDNDPLVNKELREKLKNLYSGNTSIYTFHNKGHFPYINAADEYNRVLQKFFEEKNNLSGK